MCRSPYCKPSCGMFVGFQFMPPDDEFFISTSKKNESHDLRLLYTFQKIGIFEQYSKHNPNSSIGKAINSCVYGVKIQNPQHKIFGTEENTKISNSRIYNVEGAYLAFQKIVMDANTIATNDQHNSTKTKLGEFHIYTDQKPMHFNK